MIINRTIAGKYSEVKLEHGPKIFLSVLPDRISVHRMWWVFPSKKLWEFLFPFYIRTSAEAWDSSKAILRLTLDAIAGATTLKELHKKLEGNASKALRDYVKEHGEEAKNMSVEKVGGLAYKKIINPKELLEIEEIVHTFGQLQVDLCQQTDKYPSIHFPESLLPYPKRKIQWALESAIRYTDDDNLANALQCSLAFLSFFVEDAIAEEKNKAFPRIRHKED